MGPLVPAGTAAVRSAMGRDRSNMNRLGTDRYSTDQVGGAATVQIPDRLETTSGDPIGVLET